MMTTETQALQQKVAQTLQDLWEYYTGVRPGRAIVVINQQAIAVLLEEILTPAEQQVARTEAGRSTLQKYGERILEQAGPYLQQMVAETVDQEVSLAEFHLDVITGNILGLFLRPGGTNLKSIDFKDGKE